MRNRPIYPSDTVEYEKAMGEAEALYKEWLDGRQDKRGLYLFENRKSTIIDTEE